MARRPCALLADPLAVFRHATTSAAMRNEAISADLHAKAGPIDIGAEVAIEIVSVDEDRSSPPHGGPAARIGIAWCAKRRPGLFPTTNATVSIHALTPTETQFEFAGTYDPPLGFVGEAFNAVALSWIAKESVTGFVQDIATFLRKQLAADRAA